MYLWRIELDLSSPRVRQGLADRQRLHQMLTGLFGASRRDAALLYRYKTAGTKIMLYLYSSLPICEESLTRDIRLTGGRDVSDWLAGMEAEQVMGFDLLTMPFRKVFDGEHKNSRRRLLKKPEERMEWLGRKAEQNGFVILSAREDPAERVFASHAADQGGRLFLDAWRYTGTLRITDAERFRAAVQYGIGPDKAYGLGMILLA